MPKELCAHRGRSPPHLAGTSELFAHQEPFAYAVCTFRAAADLRNIICRQNHLCAHTVICTRVSEYALQYIHANEGTPPPLYLCTALARTHTLRPRGVKRSVRLGSPNRESPGVERGKLSPVHSGSFSSLFFFPDGGRKPDDFRARRGGGTKASQRDAGFE